MLILLISELKPTKSKNVLYDFCCPVDASENDQTINQSPHLQENSGYQVDVYGEGTKRKFCSGNWSFCKSKDMLYLKKNVILWEEMQICSY